MQAVTASFAHLSVDWLFMGALFVLATFDGYQSGGARAASVALSALVSALLLALVPETALISGMSQGIVNGDAIVFGVLFVLLYLLIRRITEGMGFGLSGIISAVLCGFGTVAIVMSVILATPALSSLWEFGPIVQQLFSPAARLYVIVAGLAALSFARG